MVTSPDSLAASPVESGGSGLTVNSRRLTGPVPLQRGKRKKSEGRPVRSDGTFLVGIAQSSRKPP